MSLKNKNFNNNNKEFLCYSSTVKNNKTEALEHLYLIFTARKLAKQTQHSFSLSK